ncbi:hypothetical protein NIES267_71180 [Calothrix parasitica NIES-267]|uniref:Uncharacterized protein n=1 Tax=Calothrix parasitica NIES-267 TaxID=1973488 RepID=A0A1Z4M266_9CYAN|nr:hypothetical protein NIES267_71180 [Calothrix parasitica NIES-267]
MNQSKTHILPLIASVGIFFGNIYLASPAYANSNKPEPKAKTESVNKKNTPKQEAKKPPAKTVDEPKLEPDNSPLFTWKKWSRPRYYNYAVCRERYGNVICLSPRGAREVNW